MKKQTNALVKALTTPIDDTKLPSDYRLSLTSDHLMVKNLYWSLRFEDIEITPEQAATQCGVRPSAINEWFDDPDMKDWFNSPSIKIKSAIKASAALAVQRCSALLNGEDEDSIIKAGKMFIEQALGKASDKHKGEGDFDEEEDTDLFKAMQELDKLEKEKARREEEKVKRATETEL